MNKANFKHFRSSDFGQLSPVEAAELTQNLIQGGVAAMVEKQDWLVDRLAPPFVEASELVRYISNLPGTPNVLHLGMGDGTANEYFKAHAREHVSYSFADKVYIDPRDLIEAFMERELGLRNNTTASVSAILRSELLIPASINDVTSGAGMELKFSKFAGKDSLIRGVRAKNLAEAAAHGRPESFGNLRTLTSIVTESPELLLPESDEFRRHISPLGKNLHEIQLIGEDERLLMKDIRNRLKRIFPRDPRTASEVMFGRLRRMLANCDNIIRDDFRNVAKYFAPEDDLRFQLIEGSRSDAFLHGDVYSFMKTMSQVMDAHHGLYISDGVVSSYSYRLYYPELTAFLQTLASPIITDFVVQETSSESLPPTYLAGIRMYPKPNKDRVQDMQIKGGYRIIEADEFRETQQCMEQMAWTFIYDKVKEFNNRQSFDFIDIDSVPSSVIDELSTLVTNQFGQNLFKATQDQKTRAEIDTYIEEKCLPEIRRSRAALIMV